MKISERIQTLQSHIQSCGDAEMHAYDEDGILRPSTRIDVHYTIRGTEEIERVYLSVED